MDKNKTAFITGITGQDGYYLSKFLLEKDLLFMVLFVDLHLSMKE